MATASDPIWRIDPAEQRRRDQLALGLKESELSSDPTNVALQRDVGFTRAALAGVRVPVSPVASPAASGPGFVRPAFQASTPEIDSAVEQRTQNWQDMEQRTGPLRQQVDTAQRGVEDFAGTQRPTRPPLGGLPTYQPKPYSQEDALGFGAIATAFAALVGMRTRTPLTLALSAAGNAMQGFTKGRMDQVNQELKVFKEQFDSALATNKQHMDEYNAIMNDRKSTLAEKESLLKVLSARYHDEVGLAMLRDQRISQYIDLQWKRKEAADRTAEKAAEFEENIRQKALDRENALNIAEMRSVPPGMLGGVIPPEHADKHGDEYLATLSPDLQNSVRAIAEGRASLNTLSIRGGQREIMLRMVSQYDPNFDATRFPGNQAFAQTVGRRGGQLAMAAQEAYDLADAADQSFRNVTRTTFMPLNEIIARVNLGTGSPEERDLAVRINSLVNVYARAINPTGQVHVSDKEHARDLLSRADSPAAFSAAIRALKNELEIASRSQSKVFERGASGTQHTLGNAEGASFASEQEAQRAADEGRIKSGDRITINGRTGTWR